VAAKLTRLVPRLGRQFSWILSFFWSDFFAFIREYWRHVNGRSARDQGEPTDDDGYDWQNCRFPRLALGSRATRTGSDQYTERKKAPSGPWPDSGGRFVTTKRGDEHARQDGTAGRDRGTPLRSVLRAVLGKCGCQLHPSTLSVPGERVHVAHARLNAVNSRRGEWSGPRTQSLDDVGLEDRRLVLLELEIEDEPIGTDRKSRPRN
jgi:hypothetical protein